MSNQMQSNAPCTIHIYWMHAIFFEQVQVLTFGSLLKPSTDISALTNWCPSPQVSGEVVGKLMYA